MELKEAIDKLKEMQESVRYKTIIENEERDEWKQESQAIDTVLEELENRIPRKDIEDKIEETQQEIEVIKKQKDNIKNGMKILFREGYIENLEEILKKE